ncbi:MAG: hypothetical protein CMJ18_09525, partial [Phycisphaeraceae bacterium]|nr:hypothetical protein [Phycisphaeraceae bacterium]
MSCRIAGAFFVTAVSMSGALFADAPAVLVEDREVGDFDTETDYDRARGFDRALIGDTASLVDQGEFQITIGSAYEDDDDLETVEMFVEIEYGVRDWLEVGIKVPYLFLMPKPSDEDDVDGLGDVSLSVAVGLLAHHPVLVSASLEVTIPTGNEDRSGDLGEGQTVFEPSVAMDVALGDAELVVQIGSEIINDNATFDFEVTLAYEIGEFVPSLGFEGSLDGHSKEALIVPGIG